MQWFELLPHSKKARGLRPDWGRTFSVQYLFVVCVGSLPVLWRPPRIQRHAKSLLSRCVCEREWLFAQCELDKKISSYRQWMDENSM